ncbi:ABC transporter substrate-binding protein [Aminobacter niigataensis]
MLKASAGLLAFSGASASFGSLVIGNASANEGKVVNVRLSSDPSSFDPIANTSSNAIAVISPCYSTLVAYDQADPSKIVGDLATAWDVSPDGKEYAFNLVEGAVFHDGNPVTANDVKFTFDLVRNPPEGISSVRKNLFGLVEAIEVDGSHRVVFKLSRAAPAFLSTLASAWMVVLPKHIGEQEPKSFKDKIVGSGPFKFDRYTRGVSLSLVRNPEFYVKDSPRLDGITFFIVPDDGTSYANLVNGQLDIYSEISGEQKAETEAKYGDRIAVLEASSLSGDGISLNTRAKPFDDIRVREAISLALDREAAVQVATRGFASVGGFMPPGPWELPSQELTAISGYGPDMAARREKALQLLSEAGYPEGLTVKLLARKGTSTHEARALFVKDQLALVGVRVAVDLKESATYFEQINEHNFEIATTQIGGLGNDPDLIFGEYHRAKGSLNYSGVADNAVDELFDRQSVDPDKTSRKALVDQMNAAALSDFAFLLFFWKKDFFAHSKRLNGVYLHSQADNNRKLQEAWIS